MFAQTFSPFPDLDAPPIGATRADRVAIKYGCDYAGDFASAVARHDAARVREILRHRREPHCFDEGGWLAFAIRRARVDGEQLEAALTALVEETSSNLRFDAAISLARARGFGRSEQFLRDSRRADSLSIQLDSACCGGDQDHARRLVAEGAQLNGARRNPTARAINNGHYALAEFLLQQGADVHAGEEEVLAAVCDQPPSPGLFKLLNLVLKLRANPNARAGEFVFFAALMKRIDLLNALLLWGGDPAHVLDAKLAHAARHGNPRTARRLIARGARAHVHRGVALSMAALRGNADFVDVLASHVSPAEAERAMAYMVAKLDGPPGENAPAQFLRIEQRLKGLMRSAA